MSFPSQHRERARRLRQVVVDVAQADVGGREVRELDADRLLAGDRRQDADLGSRQRIREVVLEAGDLRHFRARGELELVTGDARPGDLPDDVCVDAEMGERLDELLRHERPGLLRHGRGRIGARQDAAVGERVRSAFLGRTDLEERRLLGLLRIDEQGRRSAPFELGRADHIRIVTSDVDRRDNAEAGARGRGRGYCRDGFGRAGPLDPAPRGTADAADGRRGATQKRADRRAGKQKDADGDRGRSEQRDPGAADRLGEERLEPAARVTAVRTAEYEQEPEGEHEQPGSERPQVEQRAASHHEPTDDDEEDGQGEGQRADQNLVDAPRSSRRRTLRSSRRTGRWP